MVHRVLAIICLLVVCTDLASSARASRPPGWDEDTHGRDAVPDYERVFPSDSVPRLDIQVSAADWDSAMADMADMAGPFGSESTSGSGGGFGGFAQPSADALAACTGKLEGETCSFGSVSSGRCTISGNATLACTSVGNSGGGNGRSAGGGDDVEIFPRNPIYIAATVTFDAQTFQYVGFRFKGNSSLSSSWRAGVEKLPFRLNFDALEDRYPDIRDQTFFGFPNVSFTNNSTDTSFLRHRVVTDLFREAGVAAPRTAFVRVFLDRGSGPLYFGVYTMTEVPDRPLLNETFGSDQGNLYKPNGTGARWTQFLQSSFPKRTNEADEDWTDIEDAIAALNASRTDAAVWRSRLEARFDVNEFLRWLALNTIVANNDAYGGLSAHNYYLYGSPRHRDRLFWIAWDHDLALNGGSNLGGGGSGRGGGGGTQPPGGGDGGGGVQPPGDGQQQPQPGTGGIDLFLDNTSSSWPLIRFLLDDSVYRATYRRHVDDLLTNVFESSRVTSRLTSEHDLIAPYVVGDEGEQAGRTFLTSPEEFETSLTGTNGLIQYVQSRYEALRQALEASQ